MLGIADMGFAFIVIALPLIVTTILEMYLQCRTTKSGWRSSPPCLLTNESECQNHYEVFLNS